MIRYEARTAYGALIAKAFRDLDHACQWAAENRYVFPGLCVVEVAHDQRPPRTVWTNQVQEAA